MVKLTASQKKKLKVHSVGKSARHMKTMIALMKDGESFSEAHKQASKQKQKQKQKQTQSQKVVINLASPNRQTRKPRANTEGGSARVLSQFVQPAQVLPDFRTMINPAPVPMPFMSPMRSSTPATATASTQTSPITEGRILGRGDPLETPLEVSNVLKAINDADKLLSGKKEPDNRATEGRSLVPERPSTFNYPVDYDSTSDLGIADQVRMKQLKKQIENEDLNEPLTIAEQKRMKEIRKEVADDVADDKPARSSNRTRFISDAPSMGGISSASAGRTTGLGRASSIDTSDDESIVYGGLGMPSPSLSRDFRFY